MTEEEPEGFPRGLLPLQKCADISTPRPRKTFIGYLPTLPSASLSTYQYEFNPENLACRAVSLGAKTYSDTALYLPTLVSRICLLLESFQVSSDVDVMRNHLHLQP